MSASGGVDDQAGVGRRIVQARRQLELTQGELAQRIGVPLGMLDRYESGQADASRVLRQIAVATGKPIEWFTAAGTADVTDRGDPAHVPTSVGQRIAESRGRRGMTRRDLAEAVGVPLGKIERYESGEENPSELVDRIATALGEPSSWLETGDPSGRADTQTNAARGTDTDTETEIPMPTAPTAVSGATSSRPALPVPPLHISHENLPRKTLGYNPKATAELFDEVAETYRRLWDEYERLRAERAGADERLEALRAVLAEERKQHEAAAERAEQLQNELERANSGRQALELMLQQSKAQLDVAQTEDAGGPERVAELETALEDAEQRAAHANERLEATEQELARFRDQEHSLAEALVWARHTASELTEKAQAEAEALVQDAQRRAAQLVAEGQREVERLAGERNRLESLTSEVQEDLAQFLLGALDRLKERAGSTTPSEEFAE